MCVCVCVCVCVHTQSCLTLWVPWTIACQAPLSMRFPRQEHWSGLPLPFPGDLPKPGIKPINRDLITFTWRRKWQPIPVPLPGKSHGWRSCKEPDTTSQCEVGGLHVRKRIPLSGNISVDQRSELVVSQTFH